MDCPRQLSVQLDARTQMSTMTTHTKNNETEDLVLERIKQLGDKSTQVLLFLSFAFVAAVAFKSDHTVSEFQQKFLTIALRWWTGALLPTLIGVLPIRDYVESFRMRELWYNGIRWFKVGLLTNAVFLILLGGWFFYRAIE
jgi:hypothetical protein